MADNAAPARRAVLGHDVGEACHWACMLTRDGEVAVNRPVANSEHELDRLFSQVGEGTLVVVDQVRNIGALPISRARRAGLDVAYLPGIAMHQYETITTNLEFSRWGSVFGDDQMAAALIDRVGHHGRLLQFRGESYRVRHPLIQEG